MLRTFWFYYVIPNSVVQRITGLSNSNVIFSWSQIIESKVTVGVRDCASFSKVKSVITVRVQVGDYSAYT